MCCVTFSYENEVFRLKLIENKNESRKNSYLCTQKSGKHNFGSFIMEYSFDKLDIQILGMLSNNARESFQEIARVCGLSGAAIHQRIKRLVANGVIKRWECVIDPSTLGYTTRAVVGIRMHDASRFGDLLDRVKSTPSVIECEVVSGRYDMIIKVLGKSNGDLLETIQSLVQDIPAQTETLISFEEVFSRQVRASMP